MLLFKNLLGNREKVPNFFEITSSEAIALEGVPVSRHRTRARRERHGSTSWPP